MLAPGILEGSASGLQGDQGAGTDEGGVESTEVVTDSLTPLLCPEAQGRENEGCIWKDLALLGPFLFLTL